MLTGIASGGTGRRRPSRALRAPGASSPASECAPGCPSSFVGDGICDPECFVSDQCDNDDGDCVDGSTSVPEICETKKDNVTQCDAFCGDGTRWRTTATIRKRADNDVCVIQKEPEPCKAAESCLSGTARHGTL
ncbi:unnamed protein product [Vitrella brassicaformis CCMP3155]|uniref:LNR domain-containing protein n=1 Tax=Vitrella brassicaformis (strain CCMP3155) TaxID=1169540 RepID=A0A0G4F310_VITBC|nr:unnamed protein product [Vitrella brassicaformis CCMP3155]|eukprot:CEM06429.1 unnamed protein product [Vitrella brassicaformis CCMP3155]